MSTKINGDAVALVNKYTRFDPANPMKTKPNEFTFFDDTCLAKDGSLDASWAKEGYILVGRAKIEIELLPQKEFTASAVVSLKNQQKKVLADAQAESTRIERQIQSLLALTFEG